MKNFFSCTIILCLLKTCIAMAAEFSADVGIYEELTLSDNYLYENIKIISDGDRQSDVRFDQDIMENATRLFASGNASFENDLSVYASLELSWTYEKNDEERNSEGDISLEALFLEKKGTPLSIRAGYFPVFTGTELILYSIEPGVGLSYKAKRNYAFDLQASMLFDRSPFISAQAEYRRNFFETFSVFGCFFQDKDSKISEMFTNFYLVNTLTQDSSDETSGGGGSGGSGNGNQNQGSSADAMYSPLSTGTPLLSQLTDSRGNIFWVGLSWNFFIGPVYVKGTPIAQFGTMDIYYQKGNFNSVERNLDIYAYLLDIEFSYKINHFLSASAYFFLSSGDKAPLKDTFNIFFSPMPYNDRAPVFFEGFGTQDFDDTISPLGVFIHGVLSPGFAITWNRGSDLLITFSATYLIPEKKPANKKDTAYGTEGDISVNYKINSKWDFFCEGGIFIPGNYFDREDGDQDTATRIKTGFSIFF